MKKLSIKPFFTDLNSIREVNSQDRNCLECGLFKLVKSPKMPVTGEGRLKTLILLEAPGKTEDDLGTQLVGDAGQFFRGKLEERSLDLDRDFWKQNAVCCRTFVKKGNFEKNRTPKRKELKLCRQNYLDFIDKEKPRFIWLMGKSAIESFYMDKYSDDDGTDLSPSRWRALCIPDQHSNAWVIPLFHPSYAMRNEWDELTLSQYERDLDFAISCLDREPPTFYNPYDKIEIIKSFDEVKEFLEKILNDPPNEFAFDYETTGLKPFNKGHKIATVSYCECEDIAYAFPLQHPIFPTKQQNILSELWADVLQLDSDKHAHGLKFEDIWSQRILNTCVRNWKSCSMTTAHTIDNREGYSGLKFQAYIRWGVGDYDKKIRPFLRAKKGSEFNRVFEVPIDDLLLYNGIDSLLTLKLAHEQQRELTSKQKEANNLFKEGLITLADIQMNGIPADRNFYIEADKKLEDEMLEIVKDLLKSDEAKQFRQATGRDISLSSDFDLRELFFDILKLPSSKETEGGLKSVDAEVVNSLDSEFARKLAKFSKLDKVKGTYVAQYLREIDEEGKIRPFIDLNKADTYRSSSQRPNSQNTPVRDEDAKRYTRSGIFPSPGNILLGFDYKALEVAIAACISKDPVLIEYCSDPSKDMHRDQATHLCCLEEERISDDLRFYAKNGFVFPEIYGSYYKSCAANLWDTYHKEHLETKDGIYIIEHLINEKIIYDENDYEKFEAHVKDVEEDFWGRFKKLRQWQERLWGFYERNGYIELATGFTCRGYMSRNKIANSPIQGPAFHCLLYSLIHIHNELLRREMKTKIINQIHDNLITDCCPDEKEEFMLFSEQIATQQIRKDWKWIIVPLIIAWEETDVDCSWYTQEKVKG